MKLIIPEIERRFATDALSAMAEAIDRPWRPEVAEFYSELAETMQAQTESVMDLSEADASRLAFAIMSFKAFGPTRDALLTRLGCIVHIPTGALSIEELISMHGKPAYIPSMKTWAIVRAAPDTRSYEEAPVLEALPSLRGLDFEYDAATHGLLCTKSE